LEVVKTVCKTWYTLCANKGKKLILPSGSAEGLRLFHNSLRVVEALIVALPDSDDKMRFITKIIRPSFSENYANFGVMELYEDNSPDRMLARFFEVLSVWGVMPVLRQLDKPMTAILATIDAIIKVRPGAIVDESRFAAICHFILIVLVKWDQTIAKPWSSVINCFKFACESLTALMRLLASSEAAGVWEAFRGHFIALMDALFNSTDPVGESVSGPLCFMAKLDRPFVDHVVEEIYKGFDPPDRDQVAALIGDAFGKVDEVESPDHLIRFRHALTTFKRDILKYPLRMSDIPEFCPIFTEY
jgi:hypothetical protein